MDRDEQETVSQRQLEKAKGAQLQPLATNTPALRKGMTPISCERESKR